MKRNSRAVRGPDRRGPDRPVPGDQRPCPFCRAGGMAFRERYPLDGENVPVWICTSPSCGYRTLVRQASGTTPAGPRATPSKRAKALAAISTNLHARARRAAMKTHARVERASRLIDKADEGLSRSDRWPHEIWIETDATGVVIGSAPAAVLITGYSARALQGRPLPIMFVKDRPTEAQFRHVLLGHFVERDSLIRPRERRAIPIRYRVELSPGSTDRDPILRWTFERIG